MVSSTTMKENPEKVSIFKNHKQDNEDLKLGKAMIILKCRCTYIYGKEDHESGMLSASKELGFRLKF